MSLPYRRPAFLSNGETFCDTAMRALLCDGKAPQPVSVGALSPRIGQRALLDAHANGKGGGLKLIVAAARHAGFAQLLEREGVDLLYVWRGLRGRDELGAMAARAAGIPRIYFEGGPMPGWVQIDMAGVNARSSIPREPAFFRLWREKGPQPRIDWRSLRDTLTVRPPRRNLVAQERRDDWSDEGPFLFCPFQMNAPRDPLPDGGWAADAGELMAALAAASEVLPEGWHLRAKPHPNARGTLEPLLAQHPGARVVIDKDTNSLDQLAASRGVITVNSAMGLEAFFHDKPVIVLGESYYSGLGRTEIARSEAELVALLKYPEALGFDREARDDLMNFLFNDYFVRDEDLKEHRFDVARLVDRHARHQALLTEARREAFDA
ncbi:capsular biosynthesis protein [Sulfitobacter sp. LCG007]